MNNSVKRPDSRLTEKNIFSTLLYLLRNEKAPLYSIFWRLIHRTGVGSLCIIKRKLYQIRFFPTSYSKWAFFDANAGIEEENFLQWCLGEGDCVVDVGANIGFVSLAAATLVGKRAK